MSRLFTLLAVSLVACGPGEVGDPEIVSWTVEPAEVVAGAEVTSTFELMHFELTGEGHHMDGEEMHHDDEMGHGENVGHAHIYLDDLETNPLLMQVTLSDAVMIPIDTEPGAHTLIARLQDADHKIIEPQVTAEVEITVLAPDTQQ